MFSTSRRNYCIFKKIICKGNYLPLGLRSSLSDSASFISFAIPLGPGFGMLPDSSKIISLLSAASPTACCGLSLLFFDSSDTVVVSAS